MYDAGSAKCFSHAKVSCLFVDHVYHDSDSRLCSLVCILLTWVSPAEWNGSELEGSRRTFFFSKQPITGGKDKVLCERSQTLASHANHVFQSTSEVPSLRSSLDRRRRGLCYFFAQLRYDLGFVTFRDTHNVGILVGVWLSVAFVYFIDLQVRCAATNNHLLVYIFWKYCIW